MNTLVNYCYMTRMAASSSRSFTNIETKAFSVAAANLWNVLPVALDQLTILHVSIHLLTTGIFVDSSTVQPFCLRELVSLASKNLGTTEVVFVIKVFSWFPCQQPTSLLSSSPPPQP